MSFYRLDINGKIDLGDYTSIQDYLQVVSSYDDFVISLEKEDENTELICNILESNNFKIQTKGGDYDGRYYITAYRRPWI